MQPLFRIRQSSKPFAEQATGNAQFAKMQVLSATLSSVRLALIILVSCAWTLPACASGERHVLPDAHATDAATFAQSVRHPGIDLGLPVHSTSFRRSTQSFGETTWAGGRVRKTVVLADEPRQAAVSALQNPCLGVTLASYASRPGLGRRTREPGHVRRPVFRRSGFQLEFSSVARQRFGQSTPRRGSAIIESLARLDRFRTTAGTLGSDQRFAGRDTGGSADHSHARTRASAGGPKISRVSRCLTRRLRGNSKTITAAQVWVFRWSRCVRTGRRSGSCRRRSPSTRPPS